MVLLITAGIRKCVDILVARKVTFYMFDSASAIGEASLNECVASSFEIKKHFLNGKLVRR